MSNAISNRPRVRWVHVSIAATAVVNLCAFAMSLVSLTDLAAKNGVPQWQAWMLPVVLEGLVLGATAGTVHLRRWALVYAWMLMILSTGTAAAGNVAHAWSNGGTVVAMVIAAIPSAWLLLSTHLTMVLIEAPAKTHAVVTEVSPELSPVVEAPAVPAPIVAIAPAPAITPAPQDDSMARTTIQLPIGAADDTAAVLINA
ncbi:DUF2637 domain-containing protein [Nocardia vinacea]|uniref:DUF2637 domain-containing protein n=1 Tax=Nocardia vinacea TaxID=96468 RepID=A0ABZ1YL91_9NOCA|nr:DUF2637 domain-containing protein [Nocardia vinacea]